MFEPWKARRKSKNRLRHMSGFLRSLDLVTMSPLGEENEVLRGEGVCLKLCGWLRGVVGTLPRPPQARALSRALTSHGEAGV